MLITTLAERPELEGPLRRMPDGWPDFVQQDPVSRAYFGLLAGTFPDLTLVATGDDGQVAARAHAVPFALDAAGRGALPGTGWDQVITWAFADHHAGVPADTVSAVEIAVRPGLQGRGLSGAMLQALRETVGAHGGAGLVAPVRPTAKHHEPATPMDEYAYRTRGDGLPADPWLRVHARAGGRIASVAPASMVVAGSLAQWREWTGLPFDADGPVEVPGALVHVQCAGVHDHAVYAEPNVWVRHTTAVSRHPRSGPGRGGGGSS